MTDPKPIPVLVPYRPDGGLRDEIWDFLQRRYWDLADMYVVEGGDDGEGPFNRSKAINAAAAAAGDWDVAIIADADTWVPTGNLMKAIEAARRFGMLVSALTYVIELDQATSNDIIEQNPFEPLWMDVSRIRTDDFATQSSMMVVPRALWDRIGGFDEKFVGWGGEDNAFWKAASILGGRPLRIDGPAWHLWHPSMNVVDRMQHPDWRANWERWRRYAMITTEKELRKVQRS